MSGRLRGPAAAALVGTALLLAPGCIGISGPSDLRREIARQSGANLDRVVALDVGGLLAGAALSIASQESGMDLTAGRIDRIEVGVYELSGFDEAETRGGLFDGVTLDGWAACVKVRDRGEEVRVFLRAAGDELSGVSVLVRDGSEVVVVRVRGDLAPIAEQAIRLALDEGGVLKTKDELFRVASRDRDPFPM